MTSIDLKRGLIATNESLIDLAADDLRAERIGLIISFFDDDVDDRFESYVCEFDLGEGTLHMPEVSFSLPADAYEVAQVASFNILLNAI